MASHTSADAATLIAQDGLVSLAHGLSGFSRNRPLEIGTPRELIRTYNKLCEGVVATSTLKDGLIAVGRELYRWLDGDEHWLADLRSRLDAPLLLEVRSGLQPDEASTTLLNAPWELLADDVGFLAANSDLRFSPSRRIGIPFELAITDYRLGVVFMASAPRGSEELDYEAEELAILKAAQYDVDLVVEDSGDPDQLGRRLSTLKSGLPHVLHLSCHGHSSWTPSRGTEPEPVLMMETQAGNIRLTSASGLIKAIGAHRPYLLFLSACATASTVELTPGRIADSLAQRLVGPGGLPAVIGWDGSVADFAATGFAREFYQHLADHRSIVEAAGAARHWLLSSESSTRVVTTAELMACQRDWHRARVWLGNAPNCGGAIVGGSRHRSLLPPNHGHKQLLALKQTQRLEVANPAMFVGRRRELQRALTVLADGQHGGVLLHGLGRSGKSSLAARIADRRPDLRLVVVFGTYDALSILDALREALRDQDSAVALIDEAYYTVRADAEALYPLLIALLKEPFVSQRNGQPLLLLLDDLEQILEEDPGENVRHVRVAERSAIRAVLRAFVPSRTKSRLIITSRFPFTESEEETNLTGSLYVLPLTDFSASSRRKLLRRQLDAAIERHDNDAALTEQLLKERLRFLFAAETLACGNPGLQDFIGNKIVLSEGIPARRLRRLLKQIETYVAGGVLPADNAVRAVFEDLAVDRLLTEVASADNALLSASALFQVSIPIEVFDLLTVETAGSLSRLQDLGLLYPAEDIVTRGRAIAINSIAASRVAIPQNAEAAAIAAAVLPELLKTWGGLDGLGTRLPASATALTRLGLLAAEPAIVGSAAPAALRALLDRDRILEAATLGCSTIEFLESRGQSPSLRLLATAAEALDISGDGETAKRVIEKGVSRALTSPEKADRDDILPFLGQLATRQKRDGDLGSAKDTYEVLVELENSRGNRHQVALIRFFIADVLRAQNKLDDALGILRDELAVVTEFNDASSAAKMLALIADILHARGHFSDALEVFRNDVLPAFTALGDTRFIAFTHANIAKVLLEQGEYGEAMQAFREKALPIFARLGDVRSIATVKQSIAQILWSTGDPEAALRMLREESLPVFDRLGDVHGVAGTKGRIASVLLDRGDIQEALRIHREDELPVYMRLGNTAEIASAHVDIAECLKQGGRFSEALQVLQDEALPLFESLNHVRSIALTHCRISKIRNLQGHPDEALRLHRSLVLPVYEVLGDVRLVASAQEDISDFLAALGQFDEALQIRRDEVLVVAERRGDAKKVAKVLRDIADILVSKGDFQEALHVLSDEVAPVFAKTGDSYDLATVNFRVAETLRALGDPEEALRVLRRDVLPLYGTDLQLAAMAHREIASILEDAGEFDEAIRIRREEVLRIYKQNGFSLGIAEVTHAIGRMLKNSGALAEAALIWQEETLPALILCGDQRSVATLQGDIVLLLFQIRDLDAALRVSTERLAALQSSGDVVEYSLALYDHAKIEFARGELENAFSAVAKSFELARLNDRPDGIAVVGELFGVALARVGLTEKALGILPVSRDAYESIAEKSSADRVQLLIDELSAR